MTPNLYFTITGSSGKPHGVKLFPAEYCSCPATTICFHIIGVILSIGNDISKEGKSYNYTRILPQTIKKVQQKKAFDLFFDLFLSNCKLILFFNPAGLFD